MVLGRLRQGDKTRCAHTFDSTAHRRVFNPAISEPLGTVVQGDTKLTSAGATKTQEVDQDALDSFHELALVPNAVKTGSVPLQDIP
jgi:hypothetical protein